MSAETHAETKHHDDIIYPESIAFVLVHLACLGVFWTGVTRLGVIIGITLYFVRMFAVTAGYHRYFSHRTFKTSRVAQFLLAALCQTSTQRGCLWWAAKHRDHHKHSDTEHDVHSPRLSGFFFSHVGWIFSRTKQHTDYKNIPDLTRYPELVWLNRFHKVPAIILAVAVFLVAGWPGLVVGFFMSTVVLYHCTFFINSLAHVVGKQRYATGDDSRNNWWLALITLGEGWHNNHHYFQGSTRQGFHWWEIDLTYYALKALSWTGLVWDLKEPPASVVRGERPLPRPTIEKVAQQLAQSFPIESIGGRVRDAMSQAPSMEELRQRSAQARAATEAFFEQLHLPDTSSLHERALKAREHAVSLLAEVHLPDLPSLDEIRQHAKRSFAMTPSLDEIAARTRQIILEQVGDQLFGAPIPARA